MNKIDITNVDITKTLESGQTFLWSKDPKIGYIGHFKDKIIIIKKTKNDWLWQSYPNSNEVKFINNYFNKDYQFNINDLRDDLILYDAYNIHKGTHVLTQPLEETLISFILATNKSIKAIKTSINILMKIQNKTVDTDLGKYYLFPSAEFISSISLQDLAKSGTGYRTPYLNEAANKLSNGFDIDSTYSINDAKTALKSFKGIGDKVADCILTFSLGFKTITPIDRWSERVITDLYKEDLPKRYEEKSKWYTDRFGENTALAGQLLFEYVRNSNFYNV